MTNCKILKTDTDCDFIMDNAIGGGAQESQCDDPDKFPELDP